MNQTPFAELVPTAEEVLAFRLRHDLTQAQAGSIVRVSLRTWQNWELGGSRMLPGLWELARARYGEIALEPPETVLPTAVRPPSWANRPPPSRRRLRPAGA